MGEHIRDDGPERHRQKAGTPTMGGSSSLWPLVIPTLLWARSRQPVVWVALLVTVGFGGIGFCDDWLKLTRRRQPGARQQLKAQLADVVSGRLGLGLLPGSTALRAQHAC